MLHFLVNLPEVLADHAGAEELDAADEEEREEHRGPTRNRLTFDPRIGDPSSDGETREADEEPEPHDEAERFRAERSDSVPSEREHLSKRIFRLPGQPGVALIIDAGRGVADERNDPAQEKVRFVEETERIEGARSEESAVGMVRNDVHAKLPHEAIEKFGGAAFEPGIRGAVLAHPVYDFVPVEVGVHEKRDRMGRILEIGVHRDERLGFVSHRHEPGEERALMADVPRELHAAIKGSLRGPLLDLLPGAVAAPVVDEADEAADLDLFGVDEVAQLLADGFRGLVEGFFLVEAGDHDTDSGRRHVPFDLRFLMLENQGEMRKSTVISRFWTGFLLFLLLFFVYAALLAILYGPSSLSLDLGCRWDCGWYRSIIQNGYVSEIPPTVQDLNRSNVAFFPLFPWIGGFLGRVFALGPERALPLTSILFAFGIFLMLPRFVDRKRLLLLAAYPATFYFFVGYSEAVYCFFLFLGIRLLLRERARITPLLYPVIFLVGYALGLTRLTGFVIPGGVLGLAVLGRVFRKTDLGGRRTALAAAWTLGALSGAATFFLYTQAKFGVWDLYFQTLNIGWHKEMSVGGFLTYFPRALLKNLLPYWFAKDPTRMSWMINADLIVIYGTVLFLEARSSLRKGASVLTPERFLRFSFLAGGLAHLLITTLGDSGVEHRWGNGMRYSMPVFFLLVFLWDEAWTPRILARGSIWRRRVYWALIALWAPYQLYYLYLFTRTLWVS